MKNRIELAEYFAKKGYKRGVEVGVCDGRYSRILLEKIPDLHLVGVDSYRSYGGHGTFRVQETHNRNLLLATEKLREFDKYILFVGTSQEAADWIPDESLDFVFIDGAHDYESVKQDIASWTPKVRKGGIVSGHDYYQGKSGRMGVIQAVDEYVKEHGIKLQLTEWDMEAFRDDKQPDWFWEK